MISILRDLPAVDELFEASRLAGPAYIVRHVGLTLIAVAAVPFVDGLFSATGGTFAVVLGVSLLILILSAIVAMQFHLALDRALDVPASLRSASSAIARAPLLALLVLILWVVGNYAYGLVGSLALIVTVLFARSAFTFLSIAVVDTRRGPADFARHFLSTIAQDAPLIILVTLLSTALIAIGLFSFVGWVYLHPLSTLLVAVAYRNTFQIEST